MESPEEREDNEFFIKPNPIVYLQDERVYGIIVSYGAYASKVRYMKNGIYYEVIVENEDIITDGD
jgi:hypothetical protein